MVDFNKLLWAVRDGHMTFDTMVRETRQRWRALAMYVEKKWRGPAWHGVEDLEQELLLAAWAAIWRFEPLYARKGDLARYVTFNAVDATKKRRHKARGACLHRNGDVQPSNFEIPFSTHEDAEEVWLNTVGVPPEQESGLIELEEERERFEEVLARCVTRGERVVVRSLAKTGSLLRTTADLAEDDRARRVLGLAPRKGAGGAVRRTARALAERVSS